MMSTCCRRKITVASLPLGPHRWRTQWALRVVPSSPVIAADHGIVPPLGLLLRLGAHRLVAIVVVQVHVEHNVGCIDNQLALAVLVGLRDDVVVPRKAPNEEGRDLGPQVGRVEKVVDAPRRKPLAVGLGVSATRRRSDGLVLGRASPHFLQVSFLDDIGHGIF